MIGPEEIDTAFQSPDNMAAGGNIIQAIRGGGSGDVTETHLLGVLTPRHRRIFPHRCSTTVAFIL